VRLIFSKAQPKRFGAGLMTGPVLAGLVEAYVAAINAGAVPTITTAWQVRGADTVSLMLHPSISICRKNAAGPFVWSACPVCNKVNVAMLPGCRTAGCGGE
jgi:hypothetical protein